MDDLTPLQVRLECLRIAVEFGTARDILKPNMLADSYYEWVMQGSDDNRPDDSRKDGGSRRAKKARNVRDNGEQSAKVVQMSNVEKE
jgi:hypothetical protein|tara:strand:- start:160 stop:420 length:261 start_codon:yes stop_codon:yes gene_type:complete